MKYAGNAEVSLNSDDQYIYLTVQDSGPGIPPEQLEPQDDSIRIVMNLSEELMNVKGGAAQIHRISYNFV